MLWSINIGTIAGTAVRIHITFLLSALAIAAVDRIMPQGRPRAPSHDGKHGSDLPEELL